MIILFIHLPHLLLLSFSVCTDVKTKLFCILHDLLITVVIVVLKNTFNAVNRYDLVSIGTDFQKGRSAHALLFPGGEDRGSPTMFFFISLTSGNGLQKGIIILLSL